jgi:adenylylsulfate kinase
MNSPGTNIFGHSEAGNEVTAAARAARLGHAGLIVWLTGLSGSGKTTLATELERRLFQAGRMVYRLDGDVLRRGLCADLGFGLAARRENVRRAGEVAGLLADAGLIAIAAFISPLAEDRQLIRSRIAPGQFIEVFINAPIEVCEQRDVKGLYRRARAGELPEFTGISSPYEPPQQPEVELRTGEVSIAAAAEALEAHVNRRLQEIAGSAR